MLRAGPYFRNPGVKSEAGVPLWTQHLEMSCESASGYLHRCPTWRFEITTSPNVISRVRRTVHAPSRHCQGDPEIRIDLRCARVSHVLFTAISTHCDCTLAVFGCYADAFPGALIRGRRRGSRRHRTGHVSRETSKFHAPNGAAVVCSASCSRLFHVKHHPKMNCPTSRQTEETATRVRIVGVSYMLYGPGSAEHHVDSHVVSPSSNSTKVSCPRLPESMGPGPSGNAVSTGLSLAIPPIPTSRVMGGGSRLCAARRFLWRCIHCPPAAVSRSRGVTFLRECYMQGSPAHSVSSVYQQRDRDLTAVCGVVVSEMPRPF